MDPLIATIVFVFGLVFGSFLNVCIYRLPREQSVVAPRSACPRCGHLIRWYDNVPVFSWLILRARCRDCGAPISPRYAAVELLTGLLFLACYARFGWDLETLKYCILSFLLTGLIFTDAETKLLPDALTIPGFIIGLLFSLIVPMNDVVTRVAPAVTSLSNPQEHLRLLSFIDASVGAALGAGFIYLAGAAYKLVRGTFGMGFGDIKLMAMVGAFLGAKLTLLTLFGASILGSIIGLGIIPAVWAKRTRRRIKRAHEPATVARRKAWESARKVWRYYEMPFGVSLGSIALLAVFFGNDLLAWYWGRFL